MDKIYITCDLSHDNIDKSVIIASKLRDNGSIKILDVVQGRLFNDDDVLLDRIEENFTLLHGVMNKYPNNKIIQIDPRNRKSLSTIKAFDDHIPMPPNKYIR